MYTLVSPEIANSAAQLVIYCVTAMAAVFSFLMAGGR